MAGFSLVVGAETAAAAAVVAEAVVAAAVVVAAVVAAAVVAAAVVAAAVVVAAVAAAAAAFAMDRLASFAFATVAGWDDWVCSDLGWEVCPGHMGSAGTSDKLWAGCRCCGLKREIAFVGHHQAGSLAEGVERCAPPLVVWFVGGRDPCRRKVVGKTPWANASAECIRRPGTGKHEVADLPGRRGVKVDHRPRRAASPAELRPERPTRGQKRPRSSTTQAGICSRSEACRSWCICH